MKNLKSKFKIKSLKWQLLFRFFVILIILLIAMGIFQYIDMEHYFYETKRQVLQQRFHSLDFIDVVSKEDVDTMDEKDAMQLLNNLASKNMRTALINKNGEVLFNNAEGLILKDDNDGDDDSKDIKEKKKPEVQVPVLSKDQYIDICNQSGNLEHVYKIVEDKNNNCQMVAWIKVGNISSPSGLIQISTPIDDINEILARQFYTHAGLSILILIIGTILGTTIFNKTLKPLYDITDTVEGIGITDLNKRLKEGNGQLEIDRLAKSFNIMFARIEESFDKEQEIKEKMRHFVSDASHELRTPLTSIHGFVEVLLRGAARSKEQLDLALNSILIESERLTKLVNDLLILTRLDGKPVVETKKEDINELVQEVEPQLKILCKNRSLQLKLKDNIQAIINKDQMKQVIFNLTQNAVLHTDNDNGIITIATDFESINGENFAVIKVTDNGTGISEKDITKIYDRFFRSESHRSREQGGYGLGLSIVKAIVDSNRGKIEVKSKINVGTTFTVYMRIKD
ncbi:integral membrane sensor signal transduction histidine kinase [Clostridium sp. DL-VIII]|uniref:sensor histidine kinase n=1 Tax=Clostridium sp. DL-VIII TaxID=641107 RepID=UPI00023AF505|nr:HAMP domain-containing sensor histidine kinase [Clostridium sp. DL-VIII]EHI97843.1 integral membrane sensor signal transduction histidine kinase [Clostridium sp. DL-VIII]